MSDQKKETVERTPFKIDVKEHAQFKGIANQAYMTTNELQQLTSDLFKDVFADYEGCILECGNGQPPVISLLFNHGKYDEDDVVACERATGKVSGSSIIDRTRSRDMRLSEGDRYMITEDGIDAITPLLSERAFNKGKPNWRTLVGEYQDRNMSNMYYTSQLPQYTKVYGISLSRLCGLLFGERDGDDFVEYEVNIVSPIPAAFNPNMMLNSNNFVITVTRISQKEIKSFYDKLGLGSIGSSIVR